MAKTIYFTIEDDVKTIIARVRQEAVRELVLVFPRRAYLFGDPLNLKLLKKQLDILKKSAAIMTMDDRGRAAAVEAGFALREVQTRRSGSGMSDVDLGASSHALRRPPVSGETRQVASDHDSGNEEDAPLQSPTPAAASAAHLKQQPRVSQRPVSTLPKVAVHDTIFSDVPKQSSFNTEHSRVAVQRTKNRRIALIGAVVLVLFTAIVLLVFVLPKATVTVYPKGENVSRDLEISLATTIPQPDVNTLSLPATSVDQVKEIEDKFQSTGKKELGSKATGTVRVYNLTGASINLKASTTTLSAKGKTFSFTSDQNFIKATAPKNVSSPTSGHAATVVANEGGEVGNLPAGTRLEITNQVFGSKPQLLYAVVDEGLTGGNSRFVSVVSADDLAKAQQTLLQAVVSGINSDLHQSGKMLAEKAYVSEVESFTADKPQDSEAPVFTARLKVRVKGLAFDAVGLADLVRDRVTQVMSKSAHLQPAAKDTMTFKVRQIDAVAGTMRLVVHFESRLFKDLSDVKASDLLGKTKVGVDNYFASIGAVDRVDVALWPDWQTSMPRMVSRISIVTKQD